MQGDAVANGAVHTALGGLLELAMDALEPGVLVVLDGELAYANRAGRTQLERLGGALLRRNRRLTALNAHDDVRLQAALRSASRGPTQSLLLLNEDSGTLGVAVVPLSAGAVLVVLGTRDLGASAAAHWFCHNHQLTRAESTVLSDLLAGHPPRAIARRNGVALSTIRSQIARITDKSATHSIPHVVMAAAAMPPVAQSPAHEFKVRLQVQA